MNDSTMPKLGRFEQGIIKRKVRQMIGRAGYTPQDRRDLEHELLVRLLRGLQSFDPEVAHRNSFVTAVVERAVANLLRDKRAEKRDHCRSSSLQVTIVVKGERATELAATVSDREYNARRCCEPRSIEELAHLASDLAEVVANLPDDDCELVQRLKTQSIAAIARETGIPRTTLHYRLQRLRQRFEDAGLRDYC